MMLTTIAAATITLGTANPAATRTLSAFTMIDIEGKSRPLAEFRGKVALVVNVASRCGLTPQYEGLQDLFALHRDQGLVVLGFPSNDFANQEPGTNAEILAFCSTRFGVTFPMFARISVNGPDRHPLYHWLIEDSGREEDIEWNFAKFLVGRDGRVRARFSPRVAPDAPELRRALASALAEPAP